MFSRFQGWWDMTWLERLQQAKAELAKGADDPLRARVEATIRGMDAISTHAVLGLIGLPNTTGNARRISKTMRGLGYIPIKSRRLMPGGYRDTVSRGWARPIRKPLFKQGDKATSTHPDTGVPTVTG
jgi:hypothetical protein